MAGRPASEGLIPVETLEHHIISPVSPLHTSERASTNSAPLSDPISPPPVPSYDRTRPEDAPMPVSSLLMEKEYPGQPSSNEPQPAFAGQRSMNSAPEKAYTGQPPPNYEQPQPQAYYTPVHPSGYASAVPLHALRQTPAPVDCPACGQREMTRTQAVSGSTTHALAALLCFCCCLGCIPYIISGLKDVDHSCGKCGVKLACWHNSGRVEMFQNGRASAV
ncbi:LPS-induced tumor necrosis factor alpha factor [Penicillium longicatenatum]|uniref:LPS-induced tumor necrosis factor alpha factor n=1 Tax=Penicillium longicatenatum TaxID=1561947 RepID=UPI002549328F|nr:LPS-induced tumor necrosis factor alpha factor [Penicillium longicatenatum]KAJ5635925.1 LPS-induced tumor necrosis factor alpha factor [Penicillium longicatenatum]